MRRRHLLLALVISSLLAGRAKSSVMKGASAGLAACAPAASTAKTGMDTATARAHAFSIFRSAVRRVNPENLVADAIQLGSQGEAAEGPSGGRIVHIAGERFDLEGGGGVRMLAFGKASLAMAKGAESKLGDSGMMKRGIVIAQHSEEAERIANEKILSSEIFTGAMGNMPDSDSAAAASR